jgi:hypothetical protein
MRLNQVASALCFFVLTVSSAFAADIAGKWKASFETQIGVQNYTYVFKVDGGKITGTAQSEHGKATIDEGVISGDAVTFVENLDFQGNKIRIQYKGTVAGDEIKFTRNVADFATEELVAKRVKE